MKRVLATLASGVLMTLSSIAPAQTAPQNTGKYDVRTGREQFNTEYNGKIVLNFEKNPAGAYVGAAQIAKCLDQRSKGKAGQLLGGPLTDDPYFKRLSGALTGKYHACYPEGASGVPLFVLNAALAEELVRSKPPSLQDRVVPADAASAKAFYSDPAGLTMDGLGRCVAVYSPGLAYRLLGTRTGSAEEAQALAALYSKTPECGVSASPKGIPMIEQRAAVATGLYHWTHHG